MASLIETLVVEPGAGSPTAIDRRVRLTNPDGTAFAGVAKQAAFVADPAGDAPTKAEFVALRDAMVAAGVMASS